MTPATIATEWAARGRSAIGAGRLAEALACFERAVSLEPHRGEFHARLAKLQLALHQHDAAESTFAAACAIEPSNAAWQVLHAYVLREQNKVDLALAACEAALRADPHHLHASIAQALMLPPIYADRADMATWRERFTAGVETLHAKLPFLRRRASEVLTLEWQNFLLAYQGENDLALQSRYGDFLASLLGTALPLYQESLSPRRRVFGDKLRVGFLSSEFRLCTVGDYFLQWVVGLPRERFHVTTLYSGNVLDARSRDYAAGSDDFVQVTGGIEKLAQAARAAELDVLIFPEVGSSASGSLLANLRLAPIQCAAWGHPTSTGSRYVDYYLSCAEMEPADAPAQYREQLLLLPGIGVRYARPAAPPAMPRARLGLPPDCNLYICPQSLYKVHPDTDEAMLNILARDPRAVIAFFVETAQGQTRAIMTRLQRGMQRRGIEPRQQIKFLPRMSRGDFLAVLASADVMIDALHWSGGNTALDALACGLPIVTVEGRTMRARQVAAMLRLAGVEELIVRDTQEYVERALQVATDQSYRAELAQRVRVGATRVFDRSEPIAALARQLEAVAGRS